MSKNKFYAIVGTKKSVVGKKRVQDQKGRWGFQSVTEKVPVDVVLVSDFDTKISAMNDLYDQAAQLGATVKYTGAFK